VPRSHVLPLLCPVEADLSLSFTEETVPVPEGFEVVPIHMNAGDVLFFTET
jgi:phytanoyl-CoA hydroxylase